MDKTEVLVAMVETARRGRGMNTKEAFDHLIRLIQKENFADPASEGNIDSLVRLGACMWSLRSRIFVAEISGPAKDRARAVPFDSSAIEALFDDGR